MNSLRTKYLDGQDIVPYRDRTGQRPPAVRNVTSLMGTRWRALRATLEHHRCSSDQYCSTASNPSRFRARSDYPFQAHEDRDLERERHPRPAGPAARVARRASGPTSLCLQEIKASPDQVPVWLRDIERLLVLLARRQGLLGRGAAACARTLAPTRPRFTHPPFDFERRIAAVHLAGPGAWPRSTCPTAARTSTPRCGSSRRWTPTRPSSRRRPTRCVLCGDFNVARTDLDVHPKERKPRRSDSARGAGAHRAPAVARPGRRARTLDPDDDELFTWWAPWRNMKAAQHRLAPRLRAGQRTPWPRAPTSCRVLREFGTSDHGPVIADVRSLKFE